MGFFLKEKKQDDLVLFFDIGSSSIGGAFLKTQKKDAPKIIYSIREPITLTQELDSDKFLDLTLRTLEKIVHKISTRGLGSPNKIFCILSSPWYASQIRTIKYKKDELFVFNKKLADNLISLEIKKFEEEYLKENKEEGEKIRAIELKNMKISLNGYPVKEPLGQKVSEVEMNIFISMSTENILSKLEKVINFHFHNKEIKFSSFAMASFVVARDTFVLQDSFLLVDIGGEVTDISMVKKDIICSSISFPLGRNFMIREISKNLNCSLFEFKSYLSLYKDGHASENLEIKIGPIIEKLKSNWLGDFQKSLVNISNDISIPATIFITVDQDLSDFFAKIIKTEQFSQYTLTESKFRIIILGTEALHGIVLIEEDIQRDPFLIIESIYINRFLS